MGKTLNLTDSEADLVEIKVQEVTITESDGTLNEDAESILSKLSDSERNEDNHE